MTPKNISQWKIEKSAMSSPIETRRRGSVYRNTTPRRAATVAAFKRLNPCPSTGEARGPCPGWIADHIEPLCAGGADDPANMQWQTVEAAKAKDVTERATCRALRAPVTKN